MTTLAGFPTVQGIDDAHEMVAAPILAAVFGPAVAEPEALHVQAKRCLAGGVRFSGMPGCGHPPRAPPA